MLENLLLNKPEEEEQRLLLQHDERLRSDEERRLPRDLPALLPIEGVPLRMGDGVMLQNRLLEIVMRAHLEREEHLAEGDHGAHRRDREADDAATNDELPRRRRRRRT